MKKIALALIASGMVLSSAAKASSLTNEELNTMYVGNTFTVEFSIQAGPNTIHIVSNGFVDPSGEVRAKNNRGQENAGVWKIDGNKFCVDWKNTLWKGGCATVDKVGENKFNRVLPDGTNESVSFIQGNPNNL